MPTTAVERIDRIVAATRYRQARETSEVIAANIEPSVTIIVTMRETRPSFAFTHSRTDSQFNNS